MHVYLMGALATASFLGISRGSAATAPSDEALHFRRRSFVGLSYLNDCNQLLLREPCRSNDTWLTLGLGLHAGIPLRASQLWLRITLKSELYTESAGSDFTENGRRIQPERFTEISWAEFRIEPLQLGRSWSPSLAAAVGIINQDRPIPGLAAYVQGGRDGRGGLHRLLDQPGKSYLSRGRLLPFVYAAPAIRRQFLLGRPHSRGFERPYVDLRFGATLASVYARSDLFLDLRHEFPLWQPGNATRVFKLALLAGTWTALHIDGFEFRPRVGLRLDLWGAELDLWTIFPLGKERITLQAVRDDDSIEPLLEARLGFRFR